MQNPSWMDRISAMTANSEKSSINSPLIKWKIQIGEINWENCSWLTIKRTVIKNPLEDFIVWYRRPEDSFWEWIVSTHIGSHCSCGRGWVEKNNSIFAYRGDFHDSPRTFKEMVNWLSGPLKCKLCYYKEEHQKGNWVPKEVLKELGLNAN